MGDGDTDKSIYHSKQNSIDRKTNITKKDVYTKLKIESLKQERILSEILSRTKVKNIDGMEYLSKKNRGIIGATKDFLTGKSINISDDSDEITINSGVFRRKARTFSLNGAAIGHLKKLDVNHIRGSKEYDNEKGTYSSRKHLTLGASKIEMESDAHGELKIKKLNVRTTRMAVDDHGEGQPLLTATRGLRGKRYETYTLDNQDGIDQRIERVGRFTDTKVEVDSPENRNSETDIGENFLRKSFLGFSVDVGLKDGAQLYRFSKNGKPIAPLVGPIQADEDTARKFKARLEAGKPAARQRKEAADKAAENRSPTPNSERGLDSRAVSPVESIDRGQQGRHSRAVSPAESIGRGRSVSPTRGGGYDVRTVEIGRAVTI